MAARDDEAGDAKALYGRGRALLGQDDTEACRLIGLAAAQGLAQAQFSLASMHSEGQGGPVDFAEARRLYGADEGRGGRGLTPA